MNISGQLLKKNDELIKNRDKETGFELSSFLRNVAIVLQLVFSRFSQESSLRHFHAIPLHEEDFHRHWTFWNDQLWLTSGAWFLYELLHNSNTGLQAELSNGKRIIGSDIQSRYKEVSASVSFLTKL